MQIEQKISMKVVINDNMDLCVQLMLNDEEAETIFFFESGKVNFDLRQSIKSSNTFTHRSTLMGRDERRSFKET